ncbi:tRNA pseudouridine synthase B [mine drainage metagenome]|uniref:tRNA pseudouridine(55) synthase n=1 Tax=mine drainage metagenome TaxID=410659 RepID=A0A1J5RL71_9ZZZZ
MNAPRRPPGRAVDGVLLLDKAPGISSNGALQSARRLYNALKAGHTGTLDPLATGLLPLCFGEATKFAGELLDADKSYDAVIRLGVTTDTADAEGQVLETRPVAVTRQQVEAVLQRFQGEIMQVPPMHSALKRDGKPLYEYARAGIELERQPRRVTIHAIRLLAVEHDKISMSVDCSKGTYIRTLAEDVGRLLGCGAHLEGLRRTRIGGLSLDHAVTLAELADLSLSGRDARLAPADSLLLDLPAAELGEIDAAHLIHGQPVRWNGPAGARLRAYASGRFLGLCQLSSDGYLVPRRLVAERGTASGSA